MPTIDYYFSVLSDWAYFGGERLEALARKYGAPINHMPMRLAEVYAGTGGIILQERSRQRQAYRVVELERWRDELGIPITIHPRYYPTDDQLASCAIIAVTSLSPLQFQKQIRLQEARSRLLLSSQDVAAVGFAVGYDSPSQFSREYRRLFGALDRQARHRADGFNVARFC